MSAVADYFSELFDRFGKGWNQFWFVPVDPAGVSVLRILTGLLAFCYALTFTGDLDIWFGHNGILPIDTVRTLTAEPDGTWGGRFSYFFFDDSLSGMWVLHAGGLAVLAAFTAGIATRITSVLSLIVILSYVHRAPMVTGHVEPVLTMLLCYLCLAPCGRRYSLDAWWWDKRPVDKSLAAGIVTRLIQVHVALLYGMMGLNKLGGGEAWWSGQSVWWLIAHPESRLVDWTFLAPYDHLLSFWTQAIVLLEVAFGLLVWHRLARPLLLVAAAVHWLLLGVITGMLFFSAAMLVANTVFFLPELLDRWRGSPATQAGVR